MKRVWLVPIAVIAAIAVHALILYRVASHVMLGTLAIVGALVAVAVVHLGGFRFISFSRASTALHNEDPAAGREERRATGP